MNKSEYKAKYSALRAIYQTAINVDVGTIEFTARRAAAIKIIWDTIKREGLYDVFIKKPYGPHYTYDIKRNKWALHHNHKGY